MKKMFFILSLSYNAVAFSQSFLGDAASYGTPVQSTYVPYPTDAYMKLLEMKATEAANLEAQYNGNKKYRDDLIDWIFKMKTQTNEKQFLDVMDYYYKQLREMDGRDFTYLGYDLDTIKGFLKEEIDKYNTRQKELPKKIWESGNENLKNNNYSEAIKNFSDLMELNPDFVLAYRNRGFAYQVIGKYSLAIADLNKYIDKKDNDLFAYSTRGWSKYYQKDYMGALADFNKQIELDASSSTAYYNRGSAKSELGDENGAISDYSKSIELNPTFSMAYNNRGWSKYGLKKYSEALADLDKAIMIDNNNWNAFDSRQEVKFALNNFKGCIEDCNTAILLNPKCSNSFLIRGRAYYKQGNKQKACEDWSKAGELGKVEAYDFITKYCK
jgi:tetratricopeptide (TPR) repeat protein